MGATNKVLHVYFCIFSAVFTVCFGALKWAQNLAGLKLVFNKLGVLWQPHWLCVQYWIFTANFTPPHTAIWNKLLTHSMLVHGMLITSIPASAYQHQNTTYAGLAAHQLCWFMLVFPAGRSDNPSPPQPNPHRQNLTLNSVQNLRALSYPSIHWHSALQGNPAFLHRYFWEQKGLVLLI